MHGNLNGTGGHRRSAMSSVDFYRRVPRDLTEATSLGAAMSICAMMLMAILFFAETLAFAKSRITTEIALDDNTDPQLQLNFNITMLDLHCDYVSVDVWDVLGTNKQNVTKNIEKWQVDEFGMRRAFSGRNRELREVHTEEHEETLEELHEDGVHAIELVDNTFTSYVQSNELVFVNFYAPWCVWCQRLHPTWEKFAEEVEKLHMPVKVVNVDCMANINLCRRERVQAFPFLVLFQDGKMTVQYKMDRTVAALVSFTKRRLEISDKFKNWENNSESNPTKAQRELYHKPENPGCQVSGTLMVNRVPGNFHIEAKSKSHNLNAAMTNLTHIVNHLSFGEMGKTPSRSVKRVLKQVPESLQQFSPVDDTVYTTKEYHQAYHHYIKVVSTHMKMGGGSSLSTGLPTLYQFLEQSQIVYYTDVNVPEARFSYDLSPMSVIVEKEERKWYDYLTSLCAIIGGTFTTLGLIDATLYKVFKPKKL